MYKLLIVDDEQIEREGMAHFIQWDKYDIQLCGTAWNGADALGKIQKDVPDIVLIQRPELHLRLHGNHWIK